MTDSRTTVSYYPAFLDITGRPCVVIGGGEVAERKVATLLNAGARVTVVSLQATGELSEQAREGALRWIQRGYQPGDLADAWLAIAATDDESVNRAIAGEAEERRLLLNVVDDPSYCSFIAPAIIQRQDLTIAVSTGGRSPAMARHVREELERLFPPEYGALLDVAAVVREHLRRRGKKAPADLWQRALASRVLELVREGKSQEAQEELLQALLPGVSAAE